MDNPAPDPTPSEPAPGSGSTTGSGATTGSGSTTTGGGTTTDTGYPQTAPFADERLHRPRADRMVAGVAAGMADYFDIDPMVVRIGFVALSLVGGLAIPLYLAGWLLIPEEGGEQSVAEELLARERARG